MPRTILFLLPLLAAAAVHGAGITPDPTVRAEALRAWDVAGDQAERTIAYLNAKVPAGLYYPQFTENESAWIDLNGDGSLDLKNPDSPDHAQGEWRTSSLNNTGFWASGAYPGILWLLASREADPAAKSLYENEARRYGTPLLGTGSSDMAMNNLVFIRPWYHAATAPAERASLAGWIEDGAAKLAEPYVRATDTGRFHEDIGVLGYDRSTGGVTYFHAFVDHSPNVEQMLWAARITGDPLVAEDWIRKSLSHIGVLGGSFGANRNPGATGTWQRSYWDWEESSPTYTEFLFNEAKQGHDHDTTWSRGQAWYVYGAAAAYAYTFDDTILPHLKEQVDYYLAHLPDRFPGTLRRPGKMVPPWDFDFALYGGKANYKNFDPEPLDMGVPQPDTAVDSSAGAMALAGILQLVAALPDDDPDRARYLADAEAILLELCSPTYLCEAPDPELSILRHGCYHHYRCVESPGMNYDNGLIWGDFFFVWSLWCYLDLTDDRSDALATVRLEPAGDGTGDLALRYERPTGSLPFGYTVQHSTNMLDWEPLSPVLEQVDPGYAGGESVEIRANPAAPEWGSSGYFRVVR
jgi:hypothetical protein